MSESSNDIHEFAKLLTEFHVSCTGDISNETFSVDTVDPSSLQHYQTGNNKDSNKLPHNGNVRVSAGEAGTNEEIQVNQSTFEEEKGHCVPNEEITYSKYIDVTPSLISFLKQSGVCCDIDYQNERCTIHTVTDTSKTTTVSRDSNECLGNDSAVQIPTPSDSAVILQHNKHAWTYPIISNVVLILA